VGKERHAVFAEHVAGAHLLKPVALVVAYVKRKRDSKAVVVLVLTVVGIRKLGVDEGAASVNARVQVKSLDDCVFYVVGLDGTCVVNKSSKSTANVPSVVNRHLGTFLVTNVDLQE